MRNKILLLLLVAGFFCFFSLAVAQEAPKTEITQDQIVAIATETIKAKGFKLEEVQIIYDDGNRLWDEQVGKMTDLANSPNFGIFKKGFMNNYRTVYFDFKAPLPDYWVFIDKDTGDVLEVYMTP